MKYLKPNDDEKLNMYIIVGEMINITTGIEYFINGKLQDEPKKGYNN